MYFYTFKNIFNTINLKLFGFRRNQSCKTALITLTEDIYEALETGINFGLVQLDFSKAFDLLHHSLLLQNTLIK